MNAYFSGGKGRRVRVPRTLLIGYLVTLACSQSADPVTTAALEVTEPVVTTEEALLTTVPTTAVPTTAEAVTTTEATPTEFTTNEFRPQFTLPLGAGWEASESETYLEVTSPSPSNLLVFTTADYAGDASWIDGLTTNPGLVSSAPVESSVGGVPAISLDVRLVEGWEDFGPNRGCGPQPCIVAFASSFADGLVVWRIVAGRPNRAWILDVNGETVAIFAESIEGEFESWIAEVEPALSAIAWEGA